MTQTTTAIYLFHGLDTERQKQPNQPWPMDGQNVSWMETPDTCDWMATVLEKWYALNENMDFPGCFDYEVTEQMGSWLYHNFECSPEEFTAELDRYVTKWIADDAERVALWIENDKRLKEKT